MTGTPLSARRRAWRRRLALTFGGLLLVLVGLELGLRTQGYCVRAAMYYDPAIGFRNRPNQERWMIGPGNVRMAKLEANALGFRGPLPPRERAPGVARVITLGDSFTFGLGVPEEETYPAVLRELLAPAEVMDVSYPGWNPDNELRAFERIGREYAPDVVVLGFTPSDLKPTDLGVRWTDSLPFRVFGRTAIAEAVLRHVMPRIPGYRMTRPPAEQALLDAYDSAALAIQRDPEGDRARPFLEGAVATLLALADAVHDAGGELLVVLFPSHVQVNALRRAQAAGEDLAAVREREAALQRVLREHLTARGLLVHDTLDAFVAARERPLGKIDRTHPSPAGYRAMAESVAAALRARGLLPE
jgi:hypothetical protein